MNIIGNKLYNINASEFDADFAIIPPDKTFSKLYTYNKVLSGVVCEQGEKEKDYYEVLGTIIDYKFIFKYSFNMVFSKSADFYIDNLYTMLKIKNEKTGEINYLNAEDIFVQNYGNINCLAINGRYFDEDEIKNNDEFKFSKDFLFVKSSGFIDSEITRMNSKEKGYNFDLDIYIPFQNNELKKFIDSEIISLFNKKHMRNTLEDYISFICKSELKYDYKLKNIPEYYTPLIFSDIFVKLVEKYKKNAEKIVEEYLINFKKEQLNYLDKSLNIFKKNVLN